MDGVKDEILKTSLGHFLSHGVRKMSNDNLVGLLGISTKTIYKHFVDKEDLLAQALELFYSQQQERFERVAGKESAPIVLFDTWWQGFEMEFRVNKSFFHDLHHYYPELERKVEERQSKKIWKQFIETINRGKKEGDLVKDIIPEAVLEGISVLYVSIVRKGEFKKLGLSPEVTLMNTIGVYLRGICTRKGIEALDRHMNNFTKSPRPHPLKRKIRQAQNFPN